MPDPGDIVGVGVFTLPEAARLTGVSARRIRHWAFAGQRPALEPQLPSIEGGRALGFYNLVEVLFIRELTKAGLKWSAIRKVITLIRDVLHEAHPFATKRLHTDGRGAFLEVAGETGETWLLDLVAGNYAMLQVLKDSFASSIAYDGPGGMASCWQPRPEQPRVIVDPAKQFGRPIDAETGVPTDVLADALRAEGGNVERVARWWRVPAEAVRQAAAFEEVLSLPLAA